MSQNQIFPDKDEFASIEIFPSWPSADIAGYSHDGETYCVSCAQDHSEIDTEQYKHSPEKVPHGGWIPTNSDWDTQPHCGNTDCGRKLDVRVIDWN